MGFQKYLKFEPNVPNVLTVIRLLLVPVYIVLFVLGEKYAALTVFLLASFTDFLDGRIARKYHLISDFGKLMDPLADKVMVLTAMFSMTIGNRYIAPVIPWVAVIVLFLKELVMVIGSAYMLKNDIVVSASMAGKVAQCAFIAGLFCVYFHDWFLTVCEAWFMPLDLIFIWVAVCCTLYAMVYYITDSVRVAREAGLIAPSKKAKQNPAE